MNGKYSKKILNMFQEACANEFGAKVIIQDGARRICIRKNTLSCLGFIN